MLNHLAGRYVIYRENALNNRFFTVESLCTLLDQKLFSPLKIVCGYSVEHRPIHLLKIGRGKTNILLWSQMHGDEPTATAALFDLLRFLFSEEDAARQIRESCTLHIIPMLNPDGAERFTRRNAQNIDINRDYLSAVSPESALLKKIHAELKPDFCFNLHNMEPSWAAAGSSEPACMAFLAPPFNRRREVNWVREQAMRVIACIADDLNPLIPGRIARWSDEFEPRAFGDNFQKANTPTILIESGSWPDDPEKENVRKYTFLSLVSALNAIASEKYPHTELLPYMMIPENTRRFFQLVIRGADGLINGHRIRADFGINFLETYDRAKMQREKRWFLTDIGDLRDFKGYETLPGDDILLELASGIDEPLDMILVRDGHVFCTFERGFRRNLETK